MTTSDRQQTSVCSGRARPRLVLLLWRAKAVNADKYTKDKCVILPATDASVRELTSLSQHFTTHTTGKTKVRRHDGLKSQNINSSEEQRRRRRRRRRHAVDRTGNLQYWITLWTVWSPASLYKHVLVHYTSNPASKETEKGAGNWRQSSVTQSSVWHTPVCAAAYTVVMETKHY